MSKIEQIGFGDKHFSLAVYIANTPPMTEYQHLASTLPLTTGEINAINQACGNGWRKVFNVYAKLLFALDKNVFQFAVNANSWQEYRDNTLLQKNSGTALLFSTPQRQRTSSQTVDNNELTNTHRNVVNTKQPNCKVLHIVCGKTYGKALATATSNVSLGDNRVNGNCVGNPLKSNTYTNNHTFNLADRSDKGQESELNPVIKLQWLDNDFAIDVKNSLVVCPYFDYRQLTNEKIQRLAGLLTQLYLSK